MSDAPPPANGTAPQADRYAAIAAQIGTVLRLPATGAWPAVPHKLDAASAHAIVAATAAGRPLLVRGEPGVGKSQLARAAAHLLGRPFLAAVVQPDSEYQELLWSLDHTARLADAQLGNRDDTRQLPAALLRRCVVLRMELPAEPLRWFLDRGETHFPDLDPGVLSAAVLQILADRAACAATARTGLAEYLDLLRALSEVAADAQGQLEWLARLSVYFKKSHAG
jgi:MoxR-like ATPase